MFWAREPSIWGLLTGYLLVPPTTVVDVGYWYVGCSVDGPVASPPTFDPESVVVFVVVVVVVVVVGFVFVDLIVPILVAKLLAGV